MRPIDFITALNQSDPIVKTIYSNGGCYQFYKLLKTIFPKARACINIEKNHVVTEICGELYDIEGYAKGVFNLLTDEKDIKMCEEWGFSKYRFIAKECPNCEEPIGITTKEATT